MADVDVQGEPLPGAPFDGRHYRNLDGSLDERNVLDLLKWTWQRQQGPWEFVEPTTRAAPPPPRVGDGELRVTLIGHATVLLQMHGVNILTDPVYAERVGPFSWLGSPRFTPPGIPFAQLPKIDVVLISHDHYDHMDVPTLKALCERDHPRFIVPLGNDIRLAGWEISGAKALDWWQSQELAPGLTVTAVPVRHWSRRGPTDFGTTLWAGFVLSAPGGPVFFAGDTGWGSHFEMIAAHFGSMRLALLPVGAYKPTWFMSTAHIGPSEAVDAALLLGAAVTVPMHYGTFPVVDVDPHEFARRVKGAQAVVLAPGETLEF